MFNTMSSKALIGKIRSIYGKRINEQDYNELVKRNSVSEVCEYLKHNTDYADTLAPYNEATIHRGQLEVLIERDIFETYVRLKKFNDIISGTNIFSYITKKLEIREILYCIQLLNAGQTEEYINALPSYFIKHASFNLVEMAKSNSFSELLESVKSTHYYDTLEKIPVNAQGKVDYSQCEISLYNEYYRNVIENMSSSLHKNERGEVTDMIKMSILIKNILIIYRMRMLYNESEAEVRSCLINEGMKERYFDKLISASSNEEFFKAVKSIPFIKKYAPNDSSSFSEDMHKILYEMYATKIRMSSKPFVVFYSLFSLYDFERENLTTIIEGIRYGVPQKDIENLLII